MQAHADGDDDCVWPQVPELGMEQLEMDVPLVQYLLTGHGRHCDVAFAE